MQPSSQWSCPFEAFEGTFCRFEKVLCCAETLILSLPVQSFLLSMPSSQLVWSKTTSQLITRFRNRNAAPDSEKRLRDSMVDARTREGQQSKKRGRTSEWSRDQSQRAKTSPQMYNQRPPTLSENTNSFPGCIDFTYPITFILCGISLVASGYPTEPPG